MITPVRRIGLTNYVLDFKDIIYIEKNAKDSFVSLHLYTYFPPILRNILI